MKMEGEILPTVMQCPQQIGTYLWAGNTSLFADTLTDPDGRPDGDKMETPTSGFIDNERGQHAHSEVWIRQTKALRGTAAELPRRVGGHLTAKKAVA